MNTPNALTRGLRATWVGVIYLFLILIPVQFYLAGHGAFEFHNATAAGRDAGWAPHRILGDALLLLSLVQLLLALPSRLPGSLLTRAAGLFGLMVVQYILAQLGDSVSTRFLAALHPVNALAITGIVIGMVIESRSFSPLARLRSTAVGPVPDAE
jgi:hypothetical protein